MSKNCGSRRSRSGEKQLGGDHLGGGRRRSLLWLQRLDGAAPVSSWIGPQKRSPPRSAVARTAIYEKMVNEGRFSFLAVDPVTPLEGGVPIMVDGVCVGAVGVSGVKSSEDVQIAKAGIAALGL